MGAMGGPAGAATAHLVSWEGACLFIGDGGGVVPLHAHYAIQVAFGGHGALGFRSGDDEPWTAYDAAIIPSRQPHGMDATAARSWALLFIEPETREGRAITQLHLQRGIAAVPEPIASAARDALFGAWRDTGTVDALRDTSRQLVRALTGGVDPSVASDERILRAIAFIKANLDVSLTLDAVAAEACLSPSRFRHLFVEETGMALRPYILWRRFLRAWELVMAGESLSIAAHRAGFADAAHLTRTARRMFGIAPSVMQPAAIPLRKSAPSFK